MTAYTAVEIRDKELIVTVSEYDEVWQSMTSRVLGENESLLWQCNSCAKTFKQKNHVREHVEARHMNVCYTCDLCQKKCKSSASLRMHMGRHKSELVDMNV